jgi:hypothetical protein
MLHLRLKHYEKDLFYTRKIFNAEILFFRDGPNGSFIFEQEDGTVAPSAPLRERTEDAKRGEHKETSSRTRTRRTEHKENIAAG